MAAAFMMFLIMGMTLMAMVIWRQAYTRREMQTAVDGMALMGAHALQQHGKNNVTNAAVYIKRAYKSGGKNATVLGYGFKREGEVCNSTKCLTYKVTNPTNYQIVTATLKGRMSTWQTWLPTKYLDMTVTSSAQINEQWFGDKWPVIIFALDASQSMKWPILGSTKPAWDVLKALLIAYAKNTFPARNGLVTFNNSWAKSVYPSKTSANNLSAITFALKATSLADGTNIHAAFKRSRQLLTGFGGNDGKNVILISDGEPSRAPGCAKGSACCITKARNESSVLRKTARAALFSVEIRRTNYTKLSSTFLKGVAGQPGTNGNNGKMHYHVQSVLGVQSFLNSLTRSICAFGPLSPRPGTGYHVVRRPRPNGAPVGNRKDPRKPTLRIYAFIRDTASGLEDRIPMVKNRDAAPLKPGWEYYKDPKGDVRIILSIKSCNDLGVSPNRRLVVRWDDPVLVSK